MSYALGLPLSSRSGTSAWTDRSVLGLGQLVMAICNFGPAGPRDFSITNYQSQIQLRLVLFQLPVQGRLADFEQTRGQHLVSVHLGEGVQDGLFLQFRHRHYAIVWLAHRQHVDGRAANLSGKIAPLNLVGAAEGTRPLQRVLEFPHVS